MGDLFYWPAVNLFAFIHLQNGQDNCLMSRSEMKKNMFVKLFGCFRSLDEIAGMKNENYFLMKLHTILEELQVLQN